MNSWCRAIVSLGLLMAFEPVQASSDVVFRNGFDPGFQIQAPDITVAPGADEVWCYYFRTPNIGTAGVRRWASLMQPGMTHFIVYATYNTSWQPVDLVPPGTLTQTPCQTGGGSYAGWLYAAHDPAAQMIFPATDGSGSPLATELLPDQPVFMQMFVSNAGTEPLTTSALLEAETLGSDTAYTRTASYLTFNTNINIPPNQSATATATCAAPANASFWWLSTRTHHFATQSKITDGATTLVVSNDWTHPNVAQFAAPSFHSFSPSGLTYECSYANTTGSAVSFGESEVTDETCMGIGFFFPAAHPAMCVNGTGPF